MKTSLRCLFALVCLSASLTLTGCSSGSGSGSSGSTGSTGSTGTGSGSSATLAVTGISPAKVQAGSADQTFTITGTGFQSTTQLQFGGSAVTSTYISATQMSAVIPAKTLSNGALLNVVAMNGSTSSSVSANAVTLEIDNPSPQLTSFSPSTLTAGSGSLTMSLTGSGFVPSSVVQLNGSSRPTAFSSSTQVNFTLTDADVATGANLNLVVFNPAPAGGTSSAASVPVLFPTPGGITVSPSSVTQGGSTPKTITVAGSNFVASSVVMLNGSARPTTFVNGTQLTFAMSVADQALAGAQNITVSNPSPGGGTSAAATLTVAAPTPGAITLSPTGVPAGSSSARTITVSGSNFVSTSVVMLSGTARPTTVISDTRLTFDLSVADMATARTFSVAVNNPAPGGGTSPVVSLTVATPTLTPVITQLSPNPFLVGSPASTLSVYGSNMTLNCQILWNTTPFTIGVFNSGSTYVNGAYVYSQIAYTTIPASLLASIGSASVTVTCPTALSPVSNALTINISNPPAPTLTSISPNAGPIGTDQKILLSGTDFTAKSVVSYKGTALTTTYVSSGQLSVTLPAKNNVLPGNGSFTVSTPAPGGGTSSSVDFTAYVPLANNDMVYNPVNGLFYASVPSTAGAPYGNSIVSIDPATGALGKPIPVGSEPNRLAVTSDGKYLWVGIDGANAVRKVDLVNGVAGLQFSIPQQGSNSVGNSAAYALAALPGATDSVVVSNANFPNYLGIYDAGVLRGATVGGYYTQPYAILTDGSKNEIYTGGYSNYQTYIYSSSGLTAKATGSGGFTVQFGGDMQIANGKVYPSNGKIYDAESGALQATLYLTGTSVASGSTFADSGLGKIFVLDSVNNYSSTGAYQVQVFSATDYTSNSAVPVNIAPSSNYTTPNRLTRWGSNGIAFRNSDGLYSLRANAIKDLSGTSADLGVSITSSGTSTGSPVTFTLTVTNNGSATATNAVLAAFLPSNAVLKSATSTVGTCTAVSTLTCNLGTIANAGSATITVSIQPLTAGDVSLGAQVAGSENDPVASNNSATATATVTGVDYNDTPAINSISPAAIKAGSADIMVTINGSGFNGNSSVLLGSTTLVAKLVSSTQMTATVPSANLASLGWAPVTVSNPTPGGGVSAPAPLTVFNVITAGLNDIAYEPFSRKIYASVGSGSSTLTGNSIAQLTPETGTFNTPVNIGSQPTRLALTSNGKYLYTTLSGANSIARFNVGTNATEFTFNPTLPTNYYSSSSGFADLAVQPGTETVLAVNYSYYSGTGLVDVDVANQKGVLRGSSTTSNYSSYSGGTTRFFDANTLFIYDGSLQKYGVPAAGLSYNTTHTGTAMQSFTTFMLSGKYAYADQGGLADISGSAPVQLGTFRPLSSSYYFSGQKAVGDAGLNRAYLTGYVAPSSSGYSVDGIIAYDQRTFLPSAQLPLGISTIEGNSSYSVTNLIRWGQDGLALLTNTGHVYLLRGPAVVPGLLGANSAATLSTSSATSTTHGAGNTLLTLTGTNFQPGVAINWNGTYRTTTLIDSTHVTVAIPASDLTSAGSAKLTAVNPGASASTELTFTIN